MSEILEKLQQLTVRSLSRMVREALDETNHILVVSEHQGDILMQFMDNLNFEFDKLTGKAVAERQVVNFETLALVADDELNAMVAVEGMVANARNLHLASFISFNTRLNALFTEIRINESTNPLDPQQVTTSFSSATSKIGLTSDQSLNVYRAFNNKVLKNIDQVLREANQLLIEHGVIPDLRMESPKPKAAPTRTQNRGGKFNTFGTVEEEQFEPNEDNPELFSMMQNLLHKDSETSPAPGAQGGSTEGVVPAGMVPAGMVPAGMVPAGMVPAGMVPAGMVPAGVVPAGMVPADQVQQYAVPVSMLPGEQSGAVMQAFQPAHGEQVQMVDQGQLMDILSNIQKVLEERTSEKAIPSNLEEVDKVDISASLGEMLQENQEEGVISAVDRQSSDIINLVTLLYDAIWQDESVPIPIKELIGRTQITIIKVALSDQNFFNNESHPARQLLNEFAEAGIGWTEVENLAQDPLYKQIEESVTKVQAEYTGEVEFFEGLQKEFRAFRAREAAKTRQLEQRILKNKESKERLEDIKELVSQKIEERILGRDLHPFVVELLETHFHKFMVMLVLKEGPGSNAWKQSINTIDVLLWSVQPHEQEGDRNRLATVNPRLLNNLRKALRITQLDAATVDSLITELKEVQEETFIQQVEKKQVEPDQESHSDSETDDFREGSAESDNTEEVVVEFKEDEIGEDHPALQKVDSLSVGMWVQFSDGDEQSVRCKLAAKINAIDKFIFVNRQGVKVVEKTRMGLAKELRDGSVRIITDGALFSRALESVIGNLRETQQEQQTGGAYQPDAE